MAYQALDTFIEEVNITNGIPVEPKGFELYNTQFDLVDELPAMAVLEYQRTYKRDGMSAVANLLHAMLGNEQYSVFSDLATEHKLKAEQLVALIQQVFAIYSQDTDSKNDQKVQRGKRR